MKFLNEKQLHQLNSFITNHSSSSKRDLLLISLSVKAGVKPAHLAEMRVSDVLDQTTGEVVREVKTGTTRTHLSDEVRKQVEDFLRTRFYQDPKALRKVSLHLFTNREERCYYTDQSMATHLSYLIKKSGINGTSMALRNTFIHQMMTSGLNLTSMVKMTAIKHPTTIIRYLTSDFSEVTQMADEVS